MREHKLSLRDYCSKVNEKRSSVSNFIHNHLNHICSIELTNSSQVISGQIGDRSIRFKHVVLDTGDNPEYVTFHNISRIYCCGKSLIVT